MQIYCTIFYGARHIFFMDKSSTHSHFGGQLLSIDKGTEFPINFKIQNFKNRMQKNVKFLATCGRMYEPLNWVYVVLTF